ncbi:MAG: TolC family protein [bacterium]
MIKKSHGCLLIFTALALLPLELKSENISGGHNPDSLSLSWYLKIAAESNPELKAAFHEWRAALEVVPQVKALPDPQFSYSYFIQEVETRVGPQKQKFELSQRFPWFGKLRLKGGIAWQAAEVARQKYEARKFKLFFEVKDAYYDYYFLGKAIQITHDNLEILKQWEQVSRIRYASSVSKHHDIIKIQVELGKLEDWLKTLESKIFPVNVRLRSLLNLAANEVLPFPADVEEDSLVVSEERLWEALLRNNPDLKALDHKVTQTGKKTALAKKNYFPNFMIGVTYVQTDETAMPDVMESGKDPLMVMGTINLPIHFIKNRASVKQAGALEKQAGNMKTGLENKLRADLANVIFLCNDAHRKINLYEHTLIPKGEQALKAVETAFKSGNADFIDLIDAQRTLLDFELEYERALAMRAQRTAQLEMIIGKDIENE